MEPEDDSSSSRDIAYESFSEEETGHNIASSKQKGNVLDMSSSQQGNESMISNYMEIQSISPVSETNLSPRNVAETNMDITGAESQTSYCNHYPFSPASVPVFTSFNSEEMSLLMHLKETFSVEDILLGALPIMCITMKDSALNVLKILKRTIEFQNLESSENHEYPEYGEPDTTNASMQCLPNMSIDRIQNVNNSIEVLNNGENNDGIGSIQTSFNLNFSGVGFSIDDRFAELTEMINDIDQMVLINEHLKHIYESLHGKTDHFKVTDSNNENVTNLNSKIDTDTLCEINQLDDGDLPIGDQQNNLKEEDLQGDSSTQNIQQTLGTSDVKEHISDISDVHKLEKNYEDRGMNYIQDIEKCPMGLEEKSRVISSGTKYYLQRKDTQENEQFESCHQYSKLHGRILQKTVTSSCYHEENDGSYYSNDQEEYLKGVEIQKFKRFQESTLCERNQLDDGDLPIGDQQNNLKEEDLQGDVHDIENKLPHDDTCFPKDAKKRVGLQCGMQLYSEVLSDIKTNEEVGTCHLESKESEGNGIEYNEDSPIWKLLKDLECPFTWKPDDVVTWESNVHSQNNMVEYLTGKEEEFRSAKPNIFREIVIRLVLSYEKVKRKHNNSALSDLFHCYKLVSSVLDKCGKNITKCDTQTAIEEDTSQADMRCVKHYTFGIVNNEMLEQSELCVIQNHVICDEDRKCVEVATADPGMGEHSPEESKEIKTKVDESRTNRNNLHVSSSQELQDSECVSHSREFENLCCWTKEKDLVDYFKERETNESDKENINASVASAQVDLDGSGVASSPNYIKECITFHVNSGESSQYMNHYDVIKSDSTKSKMKEELMENKNLYQWTGETIDCFKDCNMRDTDENENCCDESNKTVNIKESMESQVEYRDNSSTTEEVAAEDEMDETEKEKQYERFLAFTYIIQSCTAYMAYFRQDMDMAQEVAEDCNKMFKGFGAVGKAAVLAMKGSVLCEYGNEGNVAGAEFLKQALQFDPDHWEWNLYYGKVLGRLRRIYKSITAVPDEEELQLLSKAVALHRKEASSLVHLANVYRGLASAHYRLANARNEMALTPRLQGVTINRLAARRQTYQSHEDYRRSHMMPKHSIRSSASDEFLEQAKNLYIEALDIEPDCPYNNARCAKGLWSMPYPFRDKDLAQKAILHALSLAPDDSLVNHYAGLFYEFNHDHEKALNCYERATNGNKNNFPAHMSYVSLRMKMNPGSYSPLLHLDILLQKYTSPNNRIHILCTRAFFHKTEKQPLQSIRFFCKAIEVDPFHFTLKNFHPPSIYGHAGFVCNIYDLLEEMLEEFKNGKDYGKYKEFIDSAYLFFVSMKEKLEEQ